MTEQLPTAVLLERTPVRLLARRCQRSAATIRRRLTQALERLAAVQTTPVVPAGDLVLLIDGLWSRLRGKRWVLYNMALKPVISNTAWFLRPHLRAGHEGMHGWEEALATIPPDLIGRIRALVSDGLLGSDILAQTHGWPLQLCHRHLTRSLNIQLGHPRRQRTSQRPGRDLRAAILEALVTRDDQRLLTTSREIADLCEHPNCTRGLRAVAGHFLRCQRHYRTYLLYPELDLPTTTCAVESMHSQLRIVISTVNDPVSMLRRAATYLQLRPTITCNSTIHQQN